MYLELEFNQGLEGVHHYHNNYVLFSLICLIVIAYTVNVYFSYNDLFYLKNQINFDFWLCDVLCPYLYKYVP